MSKRVAYAAAAVLAVVAVTFFGWPSPSPRTHGVGRSGGQDGRAEEAASGSAQSADSPSAPLWARLRTRLLPLDSVLQEARALAEAPRPRDASSTEEGLSGAMRRAQEMNPRLGRFHVLRTKALRTSSEAREFREMLSDPHMLAAARDNLLAALEATEVSQEEELERVMQIRFLSSAAEWERNPARADAIAALAEVVLAELPPGAPRDVRGSLLGDKVELYQYLILNDRALADDLVARVKGTPLEPVLLAARAMIEPPNLDVPQR